MVVLYSYSYIFVFNQIAIGIIEVLTPCQFRAIIGKIVAGNVGIVRDGIAYRNKLIAAIRITQVVYISISEPRIVASCTLALQGF